jgi:hypothetical protein
VARVEAISLCTAAIFAAAAATAVRVWHRETVRTAGIRVSCGKGRKKQKKCRALQPKLKCASNPKLERERNVYQ